MYFSDNIDQNIGDNVTLMKRNVKKCNINEE